MHPGPMNRGVEIAAEVADLPRSVVIDQVRNGVAVRMAVPVRRCSGSGPVARSDPEGARVTWQVHRHPGRPGRRRHRRAPGRRASSRTARIAGGGRRASTGRRRSSTPAAAWWRRAWSTSTPTCASRARRRPRRSRPAPRAAALGGFTVRGGHAQHRPGHRLRRRGPRGAGAGPRRAAATSARRRAITVGRAGEQLAPMAELADAGRAALHRRRHRRAGRPADAPGHGVRRGPRASRWPSTARTTALAAGGHMHEGDVVVPPRHPRPARRGRGADGRSRHRPGPAHRRPGPLPAPVDRRSVALVRGGQGRGPGRSPPRPRPTTSRSPTSAAPSYDPVFKVNPPLRTDDDVAAVRAGLADGTIDCIATDHAPHAPETKEQPFDQAPPGMLGLETALALALTQLDLPIAEVLALLSWRPAAIAGVERRPRRPDRGRPARQPVRRRPGRRRGRSTRRRWPAAAATPPTRA